ncbi:MAG: DUF4760 domain-containing protein [Clostridiales bacterium]|nr:DUF4760 domain-containing protein [Clostridiales bacterium]
MLKYIQEYLPLIESIFVIVGVIFIFVQIRQQTKISRADHDRRKKQSTIEFYNVLSSESYPFLDEMIGRKLNLPTVNADKALRKSVIRYLSRLERLAVGIATDVYDFDVLCIMSGRYLLKKYAQFKEYIEEAREVKDAPMLYMEFQRLAARINEYRADNPEQLAEKVRIEQP